jgi:hypothetical protein
MGEFGEGKGKISTIVFFTFYFWVWTKLKKPKENHTKKVRLFFLNFVAQPWVLQER